MSVIKLSAGNFLARRERCARGSDRPAKERQLVAWKGFKVFRPGEEDALSKAVVDTRWVLTWKMVGSKEDVKARPVAKGSQDPDPEEGSVGTPVCDCPCSPHLLVLALGALRKLGIWSPEIKNPFLQADGFQRDVWLRAPVGRGPSGSWRIWKLQDPAYGLNNMPVASRETLQHCLMCSEEWSAFGGLKFREYSFDSCMYFVFRGDGGAVDALSTQIDDVLGCDEPGVLLEVRRFPERRFGRLDGRFGRHQSFAHVGMEWPQKSDFLI